MKINQTVRNADYGSIAGVPASPIARTHRAGLVRRTSQCTLSSWEILGFR